MNKREDIDSVDRKILDILMKDANTSYVDIAKNIHVSPGTVHVRMKRLQRIGIVKKAFLNVDLSKLGYDVSAFLGIHLERANRYESVVKELNEIQEVVNVHNTTGAYSILAKVVCKNTEHLREVLHKQIQQIDGVKHTETFFSLEEPLHRPISVLEEEDMLF